MAHKGVIDSKIRSLVQWMIRSLLYLMLGTRSDMAYAVIAQSKHTTKPSKEHLDHAFYTCHYLLGTWYYSLICIWWFHRGRLDCLYQFWLGIRFEYTMLTNRLIYQTSRLHLQVAILPTILHGIFIHQSWIHCTIRLQQASHMDSYHDGRIGLYLRAYPNLWK